MRRIVCLVWMLLLSHFAIAEVVQPFVVGSMKQIEKNYAGKPFILVLWSLSCAYCPTELKMLGELKHKNPAMNVVLLATDTIEQSTEITQQLQVYGLGDTEQWVFADAMPERLRFEIDKRWYGEVPRTYFYDAAHQRQVKMGVVDRPFVEGWLQQASGQ